MTSPRKHLSCNYVATILATLWLCACGVKGDPLPPERPTQLGRGRPTYRRATEGIKLQKHQPSDDEKDEEENQDEESE